jgi:hypothetical protein
MKGKIKPGTRQKNRLSTRLILVAGVLSLSFLITFGFLVFLNFHNLNKSKATGNGSEAGGNNLNTTGDILSEFTWENDNPLYATLGPDAIKAGKTVHTTHGGRASTKGLSPGAGKNDINFEIAGNALFDTEGIDISIDFRRNEESGNFYTRGNVFNFGMENGFIAINYKVDDGKGRSVTVRQKTNYEIPTDPVYRTYRFIYNPASGKAEIFVNSVVVWSNEGNPNTPLYWKNAGNIVIGKEMDGNGTDRPVFDNLVIRTTGSGSLFSESLINFMLEPKDQQVLIHWSTTMNRDVEYFSIERSINGVDFSNISRINADPEKDDLAHYSYSDNFIPASNLVYYRLRQTFRNGKFVSHPLSAIRFKTDKSLSIETVKPHPFLHSFDVSYYIPKSGRVWFQIMDSKGLIISTKTFEAPQGKNVFIFHDKENLASGEYSLNLIFDNKKVSAKVVKG